MIRFKNAQASIRVRIKVSNKALDQVRLGPCES